MDMNAIQDEIINDFSRLDGWFEKYEYLIEKGQSLESGDKGLRVEANQLNGCQSQVWLYSEERGGRIYYNADSDALITRGILALLLRVMDGQECEDISNCELYFFEKTGLGSNLSPSRANGLSGIVKRMKNPEKIKQFNSNPNTNEHVTAYR